jgi:hypothetical protein
MQDLFRIDFRSNHYTISVDNAVTGLKHCSEKVMDPFSHTKEVRPKNVSDGP